MYIFYLINFVSIKLDPEFEIKRSFNLVEGLDCHFIYINEIIFKHGNMNERCERSKSKDDIPMPEFKV